ncbi:MAG: small conductance mechanosensitive channel, partial [Psychrobacter okhotskensis]
MPTSEAETAVSSETVAGSTTTDALTYQSIIDSANGILIGFVERIPYFVASLIVILIFWFLSIVFKKIVYKLLGSRSRHQNLVKVFQRVGGALIIFIGFMIAMVIAVPGFTPAKL